MEYIERLEACRHKGDVSGAFALFNEMIEKKIDPSPKVLFFVVANDNWGLSYITIGHRPYCER